MKPLSSLIKIPVIHQIPDDDCNDIIISHHLTKSSKGISLSPMSQSEFGRNLKDEYSTPYKMIKKTTQF